MWEFRRQDRRGDSSLAVHAKVGKEAGVAKDIPISEIFGPTVQGEGRQIGLPTIFVRTGGCDFRCTWCDTLYAVLPEHRHDWKPMSAEAILDEIDRLSQGRPILVTLSGGNPAIHDLGELLQLGHARGHTFTMETQGSIARDWFAELDHLTLSPKPPSSGMDNDSATFAACLDAAKDTPTELKLVVLDQTDFDWAVAFAAEHPELPLTLQVCNEDPNQTDPDALLERFDWLVEQVRAAGLHRARVLPQLHVLAWGSRRGV